MPTVRLAPLCLLALAASAAAGTVAYDRLQFAGEAEHGVFAADLDGDGGRDLIALGRGRISLYRRHADAAPQYPAAPEVLSTGSRAYFADVADVLPAPGQEILILTPKGVACFSQEDGRYVSPATMLLECETLLTSRPLRGAVGRAAMRFTVEVLSWNFAFDADGDGDDDVLVPHGGGTDVYLQGEEAGTFGKPTTLPLFPVVSHSTPTEPRPGDLGGTQAARIRLTLDLRAIERRDINGDRRPDLVCGPHWFAQKVDGGFDPSPANIPRDRLPEPDQPMIEIRADINDDGRRDTIRAENDLSEPLHIVTYVRYFLADEQGNLPPDPNATIPGQNILIHTPLPVHDYNGDGCLDFVMFDTDIRITEVAKWLRQSFGKIDGSLQFWFFDPDANRYPKNYSYSKELHLEFKVDLMDAMAGFVWQRYLGTMMRFEGDFNGDGRPDLLVRERTRTIAIYFNTGDGDDLFPYRPSVKLEKVPVFGGLAIDDLNADGASDLILYRGSSAYAPAANPYDVIAVYISRLP